MAANDPDLRRRPRSAATCCSTRSRSRSTPTRHGKLGLLTHRPAVRLRRQAALRAAARRRVRAGGDQLPDHLRRRRARAAGGDGHVRRREPVHQRGRPLSPGVYVPGYIRRYPFVGARTSRRGRLVVCIDRASDLLGRGRRDVPLFENGQPTEYTKSCIEFCSQFDTDRRRHRAVREAAQRSRPVRDPADHLHAAHARRHAWASRSWWPNTSPFRRRSCKALPADKFVELRDNGALGADLRPHDLAVRLGPADRRESDPARRAAQAAERPSVSSSGTSRQAKTLRVRQEKTSRPASSSRSCWAKTMPLPSPDRVLAHDRHAAAQHLAGRRVAHPAQRVDRRAAWSAASRRRPPASSLDQSA